MPSSRKSMIWLICTRMLIKDNVISLSSILQAIMGYLLDVVSSLPCLAAVRDAISP
jgi:hypothetical protein